MGKQGSELGDAVSPQLAILPLGLYILIGVCLIYLFAYLFEQYQQSVDCYFDVSGCLGLYHYNKGGFACVLFFRTFLH